MPLMVSSSKVLVQIPEEAKPGSVSVRSKKKNSSEWDFALAEKLSTSVNPVDNPVVDSEGNLYVTYSGKRGEEVAVSVFRVSPSGEVKPHLTNIPNPTSLAIGPDGDLYISSRFEGTIYKATPSADVSVFARELGVPTGLAFGKDGFLYVGDRGGRILRLSPKAESSVFAELPESTIAFHLAFDPDGNLLVANPGLSSYNPIWMVDKYGKVISLYSGFGRPQGIAVDKLGNIYLCEAKAGDSGIIKITTDGTISTLVAGPIVVGLAINDKGTMAIASPGAIYKVVLPSNGRKN